jgi:hypothetical protein
MIWLDILLVVALLLIVSGTVELLPASFRAGARVQSPSWTANTGRRRCARPSASWTPRPGEATLTPRPRSSNEPRPR